MSDKTEKILKAELKSFGKKIKALRKAGRAKRITQLDLELKSGINRSDISKIEGGKKKNIEFYTMIRLAHALNVEIAELFTLSK